MTAQTISIAEYQRLTAKVKKPRNKYGNVRCELDGFNFDSKVERDYYAALRRRELAREVRDIEVHPTWAIIINGKKVCDIEMDFAFFDRIEGRNRVIDVKGHDNAMSRLKRKLLEASHGIVTEVVS